jgi:hypothetical protein
MPTTYSAVAEDHELQALLGTAMTKYHPALRDAGVVVDLLLAYGPRDKNGDIKGPALKDRGCQCAAKIRSTNLKDRAKGNGDLEIVMDGDRIDQWSDETILSILVHELTHKDLKVDKEGAIKRDDLERPLFSTRYHDREFGWFDSVARVFKDDSLEVVQAKEMVHSVQFQQCYQLELDFGEGERDAA